MRAFIAWLLLAGCALAQQPIIDGPKTVPVYSLVQLSIAGAPIDDAEWDVIYGPDLSRAIDLIETTANGSSCVFTGPPGNYRVTVWATTGGRITRSTTSVSILADSPNPGPNPGPAPGPAPNPNPPNPNPPNPNPPGPTPTPQTGKLFAIGIYETADLAQLTPQQIAMRVSTTLPGALGMLEMSWRSYDKDSPDVTNTRWFQASMKKGIPVPFITFVDQEGRVIDTYRLPADEAAMVALAKTLREGRTP